jgi:glucose/arabinose dehydrogenase
MKLMYLFAALISFLSLTSCAQNSDSVQINVDHEVVVPNLNIPWGFTFLPDNSMLITEKDGKLIHFKNGTKTNIEGLPEIYVRGQGGLMDIQLHPDYKSNGWIYFTYASPEGDDNGGNTALMRAKIKNNTLIEKQVLFKATQNTTR